MRARQNISFVAGHLGSQLNIDTPYFVRGGFWSSIQQIVGVSSGLVVSFLFGHFISKELFGEYNLVLSVISMLTFLSLPGIDTALTRSIGEGYDRSFLTGIRLKIKFALLGVVALIGFGLYYVLIEQNRDVGNALFIVALAYPFLNTFVLYRSFLTGKRSFRLLAVLSSISSLFFLMSIATAIFLFPTTGGLITGYLIGLIVPSAGAFWYARRLINTNRQSDATLPAYGRFLTALSVIPWVSGNLGNLILASLAGVEALAIFSVSSRFFTAVQKNFVVFHKPVTAKLASQTPKQHWHTLITHWWKLILIGIVLAATLWLATSLLITFFFTTRYQDAVIHGRWLSLALIPLPLTWVLDDMMVYQKKKTAQIINSTIPGVIKIGLYFVIIPTFGIGGLVGIVLLDRFTAPITPLFFLLRDQFAQQT